MEDKFTKRTTCEYCEKAMEAEYRNKRFCSDKCRVYWNRENPKVKVVDFTKPTNIIKSFEQPKTNFTINTVPEVMPDGLNWKEKLDWKRNH